MYPGGYSDEWHKQRQNELQREAEIQRLIRSGDIRVQKMTPFYIIFTRKLFAWMAQSKTRRSQTTDSRTIRDKPLSQEPTS